MSTRLNRLVEQQIRKAEAEGQLTGLAGEGEPLPRHPEESVADGATLAGHRIMAEAGALPEEFKLKAALQETRVKLADTHDAAKRKDLMAEIADLELRYNIAREARQRFLRP